MLSELSELSELLEVQGSLGLCPGPGSKLSSNAVTAFNRDIGDDFEDSFPMGSQWVPRWLPLAERPLSRRDLLDLRYDML